MTSNSNKALVATLSFDVYKKPLLHSIYKLYLCQV